MERKIHKALHTEAKLLAENWEGIVENQHYILALLLLYSFNFNFFLQLPLLLTFGERQLEYKDLWSEF